MCGSGEIEKITEIFTMQTCDGSGGGMSGGVIGDIIWLDVNPGRPDGQNPSANPIMNGTISAIVIGIASKSPLVCCVVANVDMPGIG